MTALPTFTYFPDPVGAGVIEPSDAVCECCGEARGFVSKTGVYAIEEVEILCPWCIADGRAAEKWDGTFNKPDKKGRPISDSAVEEIYRRTPALETWQDWYWPCSDTDVMCFVGEVDGAAILREGNVAKIEACLTAFEGWGGVDPREILSSVVPKGDPAVYLFQDRETGAFKAVADMS